VVLLVGGGEGMGPLKETAQAIAQSNLKVALVVIAGRNQHLKKSLETLEWPLPTYIYGFVREMPDFMRAADVLVTKAGPGTISEAFNAALPVILYSSLPGQEDGNVGYAVSEGAGVWAPTPEEIVSALQIWITQPEERLKAQEACRRLARPRAAHDIAAILANRLGIDVKEQTNKA
jgi:1,2-diacylglycerol 3-beta-galactosyltransferase